MADIIVRGAQPEDAERIARVHVASWQGTYRGIVSDSVLDNLSVEERTQAWLEVIGKPESPVTVSCRGDTITGFVGYGPARDDDVSGDGELYAIYVHPDDWNTGTGAKLMGTCSDWLKDRFPSAVLWVLRDNDRARRFYESWNWKPDGKSEVLDGLGEGIVEVRYRIDF